MDGTSGPSRPCAASALVLLLGPNPAAAQRRTGAPLPNNADLGPRGEARNSNAIAIVSGSTGTTCLSIAYDLSGVLDDGDEFRVLPLIYMGAVDAVLIPRRRSTIVTRFSRSSCGGTAIAAAE